MRLFSTLGLLTLGVARAQTDAAHSNPIAEWDKLALHAIVAHKINSNEGSRILALTHVAQWRAVQDVLKSENVKPEDAKTLSPELHDTITAAVAGAGKGVLLQVLPAHHKDAVEALYKAQVGNATKARDVDRHTEMGTKVGTAIVQERATDGSTPAPANFTGVNETGKWHPTPPALLPALTPQWAHLKAWALSKPDEFRLAPPPALDSDLYKRDYLEVLHLGNRTSANRTDDQKHCALFWMGNIEVYSLDLTRVLTANMSLVDSARAFAMVSTAVADARIAAWDSKFNYNAWRPVTAIRAGNGGIGQLPTAADFVMLFNNTPNHPEYPAGHVTTGAAVAEVLRSLLGSDAGPIDLPSYTTPDKHRTFANLTSAVADLGDSRVFGGVHYRFSCDSGVTLGNAVAHKVLASYDLKPLQQPGKRRLRA